MLGFEKPCLSVVRTILACDVIGKTGVEEFIPCTFTPSGEVIPRQARSGYISALRETKGFIVLQEDQETLRKGDSVEVMLW